MTGALLAAAAVGTFGDQASKAVARRLLAERGPLSRGRSGFTWVLNSRGSLASMVAGTILLAGALV